LLVSPVRLDFPRGTLYSPCVVGIMIQRLGAGPVLNGIASILHDAAAGWYHAENPPHDKDLVEGLDS